MSYRKKTKKTYIKYNSKKKKNNTVRRKKSSGGFKLLRHFTNIYSNLTQQSYNQLKKKDTKFKNFEDNLLNEHFLSDNSILKSIREKVMKIKSLDNQSKKDKNIFNKIYQIYNYIWYKFISFPFIFSINSKEKELNELELKLLKIKKKINTINQKSLQQSLIDEYGYLLSKLKDILPIINDKWNKPIPPNYIMKIKKGSNETTYAVLKTIPDDKVELENLIDSDTLTWKINKPNFNSSDPFEYQLIYIDNVNQLFYYKCIRK